MKLFKITTQNYTNKAFIVPKFKRFVLHDLPFYKFQGADSKYNFFLRVWSENVEKRDFFVPNLKIFIFW